jgi:hypothetical protein
MHRLFRMKTGPPSRAREEQGGIGVPDVMDGATLPRAGGTLDVEGVHHLARSTLLPAGADAMPDRRPACLPLLTTAS